jgi:hypothetical protein
MRRPSGPFGSMPFTANSIARSGCSFNSLPSEMVELVRELGSGHADGSRIDDHDVIAKILVRRIIRLVLALQAMRDLRCQAAQSFARRID